MHPIHMKPKRCSHNLRFSIPDRASSICPVCACAEVDDSLNEDCSGNRKLSSACINFIIHQFRCLNGVVDAPIEQDTFLQIVTPLLKTSTAVLKIVDNDEVGTVVSQALDKICPKVPMYMLEVFVADLSAQILEKTSFGNLESLSVLIRRKECLSSFLKSHGFQLLPKLVQELEKHTENLSCFDRTAAVEINNSAGNNSASIANSSLKVMGKIVVLEATCSKDVAHFVTDGRDASYTVPEAFPIFSEHLKIIISSCMKVLNSPEITNMPALLPSKIVNFLDTLFRHVGTLRCLNANNMAVSFCSMIKKLLFTRLVEVKSAALSVVHQMISTYMHSMEDENADKASVVDLPAVLDQVDLIHFITEAMNVSVGDLFRTALQILDKISLIPMFQQGRMRPVLESVLRITMVFSPDNNYDMSIYEPLNSLIANILRTLNPVTPGIQYQLICLFEKLPLEWTTLQYLPWIKLVCFCSEPDYLRSLWSILITFVQRSKNVGSFYCVSSLKCVLLIAYAVMNWKSPESASVVENTRVLEKDTMIKLISSYVMDASLLPSLLALITYGKLEDSNYICIILELIMDFPVGNLKPIKAFGNLAKKIFKVIFDSETRDDIIAHVNQDPEYEIEADADFVEKRGDVWLWSPKCYLHVLTAIRQNLEFTSSRRLFDLWNANVAKIISCSSPQYLPQLQNVLGHCLHELDESGEKRVSQDNIRSILEKLDLNIQHWARIVGNNKDVFDDSGTTDSTVNQMHNVTLAFYFFYVLFTGKSINHLVDDLFVERLCTLLDECTQQCALTQEVNEEIGWIKTSFYYRIALIISSSFDKKCPSLLLEKFEALFLEVEESLENFKDDVMVYQTSVFVFLLRHNLFSGYESLVETWLKQDEDSCRSFYTDVKFDEDDGLNTEVNNSLIVSHPVSQLAKAMAAKGNMEVSMLAVKLVERRLKSFKFTFDFNYIRINMHELIGRLSLDDDEEGDSSTLERFSNVIQIAVKDENLFCVEMQSPADFLHRMIKMMLKFHNTSMIGKGCLEFISKMLINTNNLQSVNQYLTNHAKFMRFLGSQLDNVEENAERSSFVFTLMATLIDHNLMEFTKDDNNQVSPLITWKLSSVFSYIHGFAKLELLKFLLAIFKTDFKCPLIQIIELNLPSAEFSKILLNLLFHLQALLQKVAFREYKEAIWGILCELLRLAEQGKVCKQSTFQNDVLFQPWLKVAISHLLNQCVVPSKAPMMSLEFLQNWTRMVLRNKLENRSNRSSLQQTFLFQSYSSVFKMILDAMKKDPSQLTKEDRLRTVVLFPKKTQVYLKLNAIVNALLRLSKAVKFF